MNDELIPENDEAEDDDLRYAPQAEPEPEPVGEAETVFEDPEESSPETEAVEAEARESIFDDEPDEDLMPMSAEVDLDAALAAVSTLDDMLAEQEAAEQAEIARQEAEIEAEAQRRARLSNPEFFFPMPPMLSLQRGRMDSVVPALALILLGIWLTFTLTSGGTIQPVLVIAVVGAALAVTLLAHWLASGRWALGALFFALLLLLTGGILLLLFSNNLLVTGWPLLLIGPGLAFMLTGLIAVEARMLLPGLLICVASLAALLVTYPVLPESSLSTLATLWPVALLIVIILLVLPIFSRRARE